ncbi:SDR family NAD(P)-dependent oxidoreductase [Mucilaginibacter sp. Bleaf8]|uniref:SDR family NAD(P)-dependent oxidoreductase n=1 Tax=Mucilaginibacter sp. Bleaf8 TaxID=2834430 RepID=UPI001BCF7FF2|nr:SDR family NAD(P)-dependent oxidoreductase [Mucilaginibacter sp. Bleaf8]MBS7566781.1 SDR family NAD(P)-dependent oxidoreductase [Mucilaginibacter sp. Bleaf8]
MDKKVWYVTGASKGLGLALVKQLLAAGYRVAATSRSADAMQSAVGDTNSNQFLPLEVDLGDAASVNGSIEQTVSKFGRVDVVVNNAGFGIGGSLEELSEKEIVDSFGVNVYGTIKVIKAALPVMRKQRSGHIINISSIAGFAAATGWSVYAATKFAVIGLSEVLADDVREFGINVTVVAPGAFRTEFLSEQSLVLAENKMEEYEAVRASHTRYLTMNGKQAGDPQKAAEVFIRLAEMPEPPVRFFMGTDAYNRALQKTDQLKANLEQWKELSSITDFGA